MPKALALAALLGPALIAQAAPEDSDALFLRARALPRERREEARALCRQALERSPGYHDIRIHLARLYAWDSQYEDARRELQQVLRQAPGNREALEAAMDVEVWADRPHEALRLCSLGQADASLLYRKARILKSLGDLPGALASVQAALVLDPDHQPSRLLREDLKELAQRSKVALDHTVETFSSTFDPWRTSAVSVGHRFDRGSVIARATRAQRFGSWGTQIELDAYPRIVEGTYAYLSVGRSDDSLFPSYRTGAELFHNFKGGLEGSLGLRHLAFASSEVTIYTGSLGKYHGSALYTLRVNLTPSAAGSSFSGSLAGRWYLDDADSYYSLVLGMGFSPDQPAWSTEVVRLRSRSASAGLQKRLARSWTGSVSLGWERQEFLPELWRTHRKVSAGLEKRF